MSVSTPAPSAKAKGKRSALTGAALSDEVFDSSPSLLRPNRGRRDTVAGLQRYTHVLPGELERARELLDAFLRERAQQTESQDD
jgi:hypothetical protein